jgi:ubiquinone/menaquinone biosynthesis C-methylase UbiE
MFKMFQRSAFSGNKSEFWEENWSQGSVSQAISFYDINPDRDIFDRFLPQQGLILEGGCGLGQYVVIWSNDSRKVVGLDFTLNPLKNLKQHYPEFSNYVVNGDVSKLPFPDNTFDAYYSGGVVEHFEDGPYEALSEAYRVLKPNGYLIISVPFYNLVRFMNNHLFYRLGMNGKGIWLKRPSSKIKFSGYNFFQYAYKKQEFKSFLEQAGFNVIFSKKNGFLWGLRELSIIDSIMKRLGKSTKSEQVIVSTEKNELVKEKKSSNGKGTVKSFIKRIIIKEDANICPPVAILQMLFSNMMFFIAIPKK